MHTILGRNISTIYRNEHHYVDLRLKKYNLNKVQAEALLFLLDNNGINQTELNKFFLFNKATITKIVAHLIKSDYVSSEVSQNDRREKEIFLTDNSRKVLPEIIEVLDGWEEVITANIPSDDVESVKKVLAQMVHNITNLKEEIND